MRTPLVCALTAMTAIGLAAQNLGTPPRTLPAAATEQLAKSLSAAIEHPSHIWRDTRPVNADGTVNGSFGGRANEGGGTHRPDYSPASEA